MIQSQQYNQIYRLCGIYFVLILLHYVSSHLYVYLCVPSTWKGFILSPIQTPTPHCVALRYIIYNGGENINKMWILIGIWVCGKITSERMR